MTTHNATAVASLSYFTPAPADDIGCGIWTVCLIVSSKQTTTKMQIFKLENSIYKSAAIESHVDININFLLNPAKLRKREFSSILVGREINNTFMYLSIPIMQIFLLNANQSIYELCS